MCKLEDVSGNLKGMDSGDMMDPQIAIGIANQERQYTDTHWRAKEGKASFNWRTKFPITLTNDMKYQRMTVQLWDRDIITSNYMIGDATLSLDRWFRRSFKKRTKQAMCAPDAPR